MNPSEFGTSHFTQRNALATIRYLQFRPFVKGSQPDGVYELLSPDTILSTVNTPSSKPGDQGWNPSSESVTIDDQGDVILVASSTRLRVSSNVLRLASPVFRAMLEPGRFLEGQTYRDSDDPLTVQLEDDDPIALTTLCKILHFKRVELSCNVKLLVTFAEVCDKYCCRTAVLFHVTTWLSEFEHSRQTSVQQMELL